MTNEEGCTAIAGDPAAPSGGRVARDCFASGYGAMLPALIHGYLLAFGLILPLGPQNVFVFSQGIIQPRLIRAVPVAAAAAVCDTLLILAAVLGASGVVRLVPRVQLLLMGAGGVFLLWVGWVTWRSEPTPHAAVQSAAGWTLRRQVLFAVSVSLLNPHAILDTVGVIGPGALQHAGRVRVAFTAACVVNSWVWFFLLAGAGRYLGRLDRLGRWRRRLNRASALLMWGFAIYLAGQVCVAVF